ncbi:MAG: MCE family protein [Kiritimatiellae bacterium]|nr:MCE family protein [Kiritimatiellia bacterium]
MASDNHAHYSKIGFAVLLGTAAVVATLIWLGGVRGDDEPVFVETCYDRPVTGLSVGSTVNFRGVPVGKVALIDFIGNHYEGMKAGENTRIYIKMALSRKSFRGVECHGFTPEAALKRLVDSGLRATVTASGITGLSHVEFNIFPDAPPPSKLDWMPHCTYVPPKMSLLEDFSSSATRVMNQINTMDFAGVWSNISATVEHVKESTRQARLMMDERRVEIGRIIDSVGETVDSLKEVAAELKRNPSMLIRDRRAEPLEETR